MRCNLSSYPYTHTHIHTYTNPVGLPTLKSAINSIIHLTLQTKKNRALKRAGEEAKQRKLKEDEILKLEVRLGEIHNEEQALRSELEKNMKYQVCNIHF